MCIYFLVCFFEFFLGIVREKNCFSGGDNFGDNYYSIKIIYGDNYGINYVYIGGRGVFLFLCYFCEL